MVRELFRATRPLHAASASPAVLSLFLGALPVFLLGPVLSALSPYWDHHHPSLTRSRHRDQAMRGA